MLRILWNSRTAMMAQQEKLDSISNNLANVNTEGYKRTEVSFKDLVYETLDRKGYPNSGAASSYNGTGVRTSELLRDNRQGNLSETKVNTDLAIDGQGYFQVTSRDGNIAYTRNGSFNVDGSGNIVDKNGDKLNITFNNGLSPEDRAFSQAGFKVDESGKVYNNSKEVGKINLYTAVGDKAFSSIGNNLYVPNKGVQVSQTQDFSIRQGYLEMSNVDIASEMTDMIITQRAFELSSKGMKTADEMWGMANNLKSR